MPPPRMPSLELLYDLAGEEHRTQVGHFQSLDAKAGLVLGFAGALVALSQGSTRAVSQVGRGLGATAALVALLAFLPRRMPLLDLELIVADYLRSEEAFTRSRVIRARVGLVARGSEVLEAKARRLGLALILLAAAVTCLAGGMLA